MQMHNSRLKRLARRVHEVPGRFSFDFLLFNLHHKNSSKDRGLLEVQPRDRILSKQQNLVKRWECLRGHVSFGSSNSLLINLHPRFSGGS